MFKLLYHWPVLWGYPSYSILDYNPIYIFTVLDHPVIFLAHVIAVIIAACCRLSCSLWMMVIPLILKVWIPIWLLSRAWLGLSVACNWEASIVVCCMVVMQLRTLLLSHSTVILVVPAGYVIGK